MAKKRILLRKKKFVESTGYMDIISKNGKVVLSIGIAFLILLVSGYLYIRSYKKTAFKTFTKGRMLYDEAVAAEGEAKALKDYEESAALFKEIISSSYPGNKFTPLAYLFLGDIYYQTEKYPDALESYSHILKGNYDDSLKVLALYSTGKILESMGKFDEAIKRYEELNETDSALKGLALMDLGRLYEKQKKPTEAVDRFRDFLTVNPDSVLGDKARYRISILENQIGN